MKSVQQSIMDYIDECVDEIHRKVGIRREITISKDWENTGRLYLTRGEDTYEVKYNFQTDSCTLKYAGGERHYKYGEDMPLLKQHLRSFVAFGDPKILR